MEIDTMDLGRRCARIRELDKLELSLREERKRLYTAGLDEEDRSILWRLVTADGLPHITY